LALVLEQPTELNPLEIMTDTGAYTDVVFGLFWLLGYRFSPRIADIGGARYWRMDPSADYGCLNGVARHRINTKLIAEHWDDLLRLSGSLKLGVIQATSVMRTLQIADRPTKLAQAVPSSGGSTRQFTLSPTSTLVQGPLPYPAFASPAEILEFYPIG
jgi:TnpA family transposase